MESGNSDQGDRSSVFDALASVIKAMGNGRRLELIELLAQGEHSVEVLSRMSGMGLTTVSSHLQTLKRAGLVATRRERTTIHYRLAGDDVAQLYLAAKRAGLQRSPGLREALAAYMSDGGAEGAEPTIDASAITAQMTVIDVRPREEFAAGHFPGALSIPMAELESRYTSIPAGAQVVVYCRGEFCRMARQAATWLCDEGISAIAMDEGVIEWRATNAVNLDAVT